MPAIHFTKRGLEAIQPDPAKRLRYLDDETPHLELIVTPAGVKTFYLYRRINGEPARVKIGRFPAVTLDKAREKADILNGKIADGIDPRDPLRARRDEMTLAQFFDYYLERHTRPRTSTIRFNKWMFQKYVQRLHGKKLSAIHNRDIATLHSRVGTEAGHAQANRLLTLLRAMFNKAIAWGAMDGPNPATGIDRYREVSRERYLQPEELPRFFKALAEEPSQDMRDFVQLALLTGARKSNVLGMRWADLRLDVDDPTWTIPAADAKAGEAITVPLVEEAKAILQARHPADAAATGASPWVFPSRGETGHLVEVKSGWERILKRAGIIDLHLHDLRRSMGSWQARTGASLVTIGRSLGHRSVSTTMIYSRLGVDPVRESMEKATRAMLTAGGILPTGDVTSLPRRRGKL